MNTLMNVLFFGALVLYFIGAVLQFIGSSFKKPGLTKAAWLVFLVGFAAHTVYLVVRGVVAHRLPLANQFEFAAAFAWGVALIMIVLNARFHADWIAVAAMPAAFLILSYAALQPREITELMPALKSAWFGFHIGSAAISYSCFILAGAAGLRWLLLARHLGRAGVVRVLDVGPQGGLGAHHVDHLRGLSPSPPAPEALRQGHGVVRDHRRPGRALHVRRREHPHARPAQLWLIKTPSGCPEGVSALAKR